MYIWLSIACCMCTRICYEEHRERNPQTRLSLTYIKRKCCCCLNSYKPIITENELTESFHDVEERMNDDEPPDWTRN